MTRNASFCIALIAGLVFGCSPSSDLTGDLQAPVTGKLTVTIGGLPNGSAPLVSVTNALGYGHNLSGTETLTSLTPGAYAITALEVPVGGDRYGSAPATQTVVVAPGLVPASAVVNYVAVTGHLRVVVDSVPQGATAQVLVTGPGGFTQTLTDSATLVGLAPGPYSIAATRIELNGDFFDPEPITQSVQLAALGSGTIVATITYRRSSGRMALAVSGLPGGVAAALAVSGPNGFAQAVTASTTLAGLLPGSYTVTASPVTSAGNIHQPGPPTSTVSITASETPVNVVVVYALSTGSLQVLLAGLPGGAGGAVSVTGPQGYSANLTASTLLTGLIPGNYTVAAAGVSVGGSVYVATPPTQSATIIASLTPEVRSVTYALGVGSLAVTIAGLPGDAAASLTVSGPLGYNQTVAASQLLTSLAPGTYTLTAAPVTASSIVYGPSPATQNVSVAVGASSAATVTYSAQTGGLTVTVSGLPGGTTANVLVTGPGGFSQTLTGSQFISGLAPGSYTVSGSSVVNGGTTYNASPAQAVTVAAGSTASASVTYTAAGGGASLNLRVDGVYLTQATQTYDGLVPLVAGRDAYLRAFAVANEANTAQPPVRVRLYTGAVLVQTYTIAAPSGSVPTSVTEGTLGSSWNVLVPAALVQPGLRVLADADPANAIAEADETDNQFPSSGASMAVDVRSLPVFSIRFVPVLQQVNGLQGNVTGANKEAFLTATKAMLPVGAYDADVRAVYTTTAPALESGNGNGAWGTILSEVLALRSADASTRYYYGVVKTSYGSGVVGMGYVGGSARTSIGWDVMSSAPSTMAHELGHNMGRSHAPCGGPGGPDPSYPYAGGLIGVFGLDVSTLTIKATSIADLMGYCQPTWISDYTWKGMMTYRQSGPNNAPQAMLAGSGLLVWGRITSAGVVLEPAFRVEARVELLPAAGPNRLDLLAENGRLLRSVRFDATTVADLPGGDERHFAFVVPIDDVTERDLAGFRVQSSAGSASRLPSPGSASPDPEPRLSRVNAQQVQVGWNAARYPMVMVKDARTGQVLSFARGGSARLWTTTGDFQLIFSDGVKSVARPGRILR